MEWRHTIQSQKNQRTSRRDCPPSRAIRWWKSHTSPCWFDAQNIISPFNACLYFSCYQFNFTQNFCIVKLVSYHSSLFGVFLRFQLFTVSILRKRLCFTQRGMMRRCLYFWQQKFLNLKFGIPNITVTDSISTSIMLCTVDTGVWCGLYVLHQ